MKSFAHARRFAGALTLTVIIFGMPLALVACDKDTSTSKTTTTKTTSTPEGVKRTTQTTEKKVETEQKK